MSELNRKDMIESKYFIEIDCKSVSAYNLIKDNLTPWIEKADLLGLKFLIGDESLEIKIKVLSGSSYHPEIYPGFSFENVISDYEDIANYVHITRDSINDNVKNSFYGMISKSAYNNFVGIKDHVDSEIIINIDDGLFVGFTGKTYYYPIITFVRDDRIKL